MFKEEREDSLLKLLPANDFLSHLESGIDCLSGHWPAMFPVRLIKSIAVVLICDRSVTSPGALDL